MCTARTGPLKMADDVSFLSSSWLQLIHALECFANALSASVAQNASAKTPHVCLKVRQTAVGHSKFVHSKPWTECLHWRTLRKMFKELNVDNWRWLRSGRKMILSMILPRPQFFFPRWRRYMLYKSFHSSFLQWGRYAWYKLRSVQDTGTWFPKANPDNKVHGTNMGRTWVLSAPDGPHVGPMNLAIREGLSPGVHVPDKPVRAMGTMPRYSAHICFIAYIFKFSIPRVDWVGNRAFQDCQKALCHWPLTSEWGCPLNNQISKQFLHGLECSRMKMF